MASKLCLIIWGRGISPQGAKVYGGYAQRRHDPVSNNERSGEWQLLKGASPQWLTSWSCDVVSQSPLHVVILEQRESNMMDEWRNIRKRRKLQYKDHDPKRRSGQSTSTLEPSSWRTTRKDTTRECEKRGWMTIRDTRTVSSQARSA